MPAARRILLIILVLFLLVLLFAVPSVSFAKTDAKPEASVQRAARDFGRKIVAHLLEQQAVWLEFHNLSALSEARYLRITRIIEGVLSEDGRQLCDAPHERCKTVRVTFSERADSSLWIGEVGEETVSTPIFFVISSSVLGIVEPPFPRVLLKREFVWEQEQPILDLEEMKDPSGAAFGMLILEPHKLSLYRKDRSGWQLSDSSEIASTIRPSRDPRGRIVQEGGFFRLHLSNAECEGSALSSIKMNCELDVGPWPDISATSGTTAPRIAPGRNYFGNSALKGAEHPVQLPPFLDARSVDSFDGSNYAIVTVLDGHTKVYEETSGRLEDEFTDMGSDLETDSIFCADDPGFVSLLLATRPGDWAGVDAVTAFAFVGRRPIAISQPLDFPGPVTTLRKSSDGESSIAVTRSLRTGRYEAYRLTISCGK